MGGVKTENMKTEVMSQESEWGRPRAMLASSRRCRRPGAEGIRSAETIGIWKAGGDGTRRVMRRGFTALSGWEAGEQTGFSHIVAGSTRLFPHVSTQVVDFPRMSVVSIFLKDEKQLDLVRGIPSGAWNQDGEAIRNRQGRRAGGRSRGFSVGAEPRHARARVLPEQTERSLMFA